ncbi:DUF1553 domain-containing protein [Membranihabitans maritimus]|uniref:DUF1553 domain-containing protein n=1 Tax=Membranihabitans maritimus TaxID=2904244 RepID=UPI001F408BB2|nr:DUF1553 domain-containing protein [Membranihabitans maritimus]
MKVLNRKYLFVDIFFYGLLIATGFQSCTEGKPEVYSELEAQLPEKIDYNLHVKPILSDKCFFCHGPDKNSQKAGLDLSNPESAFASLESSRNKHAVVPGKWSQSELVHRIISDDHERLMPPLESNRELSEKEKAILIKWIDQGAEYKPHWAFIPPENVVLPGVKNTAWIKNGIDHFVLKKLEDKGMEPSPEASKETLIRRVTLDLIGLPPTLEEIDAFLKDDTPGAYEKVVDRLLRSKRYGEKMAVSWMDLSRFADTHGYTVDRYRPMWPWRDWVIEAFNGNMPYDEFVTWQLAGDLLPDATKEQRLATAFNRNHSQNMEGGIVNEEFRVEYVADRTNTLGTAFLGVTMECARCHDHKYDPISQKDYYSVFGFFNNIDEVGQISWDNAMPVPTMMLTDEKKDSIITFLDSEIEQARAELDGIKNRNKSKFNEWAGNESENYNFEKEAGLVAHFTFDKFDKGVTKDKLNPDIQGEVLDPKVVKGRVGNAFQSNGDDILNLGPTGVFGRGDPFSIGLWINIPEDLTKGVVFHKGNGDILYNFRGYFLNIKGNKAEILMAHTWPYNSIVKVSQNELPKNEWIHVLMTYDGSGKAEGIRFYLNGEEKDLVTENDNLYKGILFNNGGLMKGEQPGLQLGADWRGKGFTDGLMDDLLVYDRELTSIEVLQLWNLYQGRSGSENIDSQDPDMYAELYFNRFSEEYKQQKDELRKARKKKFDFVENIPEIMVMDEMEDPRTTYVLERGEYDAHGEEVQPDVPDHIMPFPDSLPENRLGLAKWLFHPDHPLTSRVAVNRFWQSFFGRGIHKNIDDFGNQGGLPSNLPLLDWLANEFVSSGWDIKAMQKLIVMSATYRQSSLATEKLMGEDPENVLLARGPSSRLSAELIRDGALAASGLMSGEIGGPSVKPYQPEGVWEVVSANYNEGTGDELYRRSLYTFWRRTVPPPSMNTFDAPSRSYCTVRRQETNTPLQALVLLNDPQFLEASKVVSEKALKAASEAEEQIVYMFRLLTARKPVEKELKIMVDLYNKQYEKFQKNSSGAESWVNIGQYRTDPKSDPAALAAGTVVANTIMNSDAYITKR